MANKKQKSKARLDKYYKIAKQQGYRSRAAFKLIQLNKKYSFLQKAAVLVDLCAAPGGWLQVASKTMGHHSIIIGIDLDKIKPIPGVKTFQEDITTVQCVQILKSQLKGYQVDIFLNDGAPNVGGNWNKDSHIQCQLVLSALKLACQFLRKGGWFITKVFRSNDFNSLKWVLNKFFNKVQVTKPLASRTTSAEIFVVCSGYQAPEFIDQKLFDAAQIFKDTQADMAQQNSGINSLKSLMVRKRNRSGYDSDMPHTMSRSAKLSQFIQSSNPFEIFHIYNVLQVSKEQDQKYSGIVAPPKGYRQYCEDLKVLGAGQIGQLIKWRGKIRNALSGRKSQAREKQNADSQEQLQNQILSKRKEELKEHRKKMQKINKKDLQRRKAGDGIEHDDFQYQMFTKLLKSKEFGQDHQEPLYSDQEQDTKKPVSSRLPVTGLSLQETERQLDMQHQRKKSMQLQQKERREGKREQEQMPERYQRRVERVMPKVQGQKREREQQARVSQIEREDKFENPLKKKRKVQNSSSRPQNNVLPKESRQEDDQFENEEELYQLDLPKTELQKRKKKLARQQKKVQAKKEQTDETEIEVVPQKSLQEYNIESLAETLAIAKKMLRKRNREDIIAQSYLNPQNQQQQDLPEWFRDDQDRHCFKKIPITKAEYQAQKERLMAINSKSIRKVQEAQYRKKRKVQLKMKRANQKAKAILSQEGVSQSFKLRQANRIYKKQLREQKKQKKYIVGQKGKTLNKGSKLTKFVDARLKKDKRSVNKRIKKSRHVNRRKGR